MIVDEAMNEKEHHKRLPLKHPSLNPHSLEHKGPDWHLKRIYKAMNVKGHLKRIYLSIQINSGIL